MESPHMLNIEAILIMSLDRKLGKAQKYMCM